MIGYMYHSGTGVRKDPREAVRWIRKAAEHGDPVSQYNLGMSCMKGDGVSKDVREGLGWMMKAAARGFPPAVSFISGISGGEDNQKS